MKKLVVLFAALALSATMFAADGLEAKGFKSENGPKKGMMRGEEQGKGGFKIFERIPKEDFLKAGVSEENYTKAKTLLDTNKVIFEKNNIAIQQKHLEIKKLTLEENKNYSEIEKLFNEIGKLKTDNGVREIKLIDELRKNITEEQLKAAIGNFREKHPDKENKEGKKEDMKKGQNRDK